MLRFDDGAAARRRAGSRRVFLTTLGGVRRRVSVRERARERGTRTDALREMPARLEREDGGVLCDCAASRTKACRPLVIILWSSDDRLVIMRSTCIPKLANTHLIQE